MTWFGCWWGPRRIEVVKPDNKRFILLQLFLSSYILEYILVYDVAQSIIFQGGGKRKLTAKNDKIIVCKRQRDMPYSQNVDTE
jgi:hypothetical protein